MASPLAHNRALRAAAGGGIDADAVAAKARELGVMGWVRPAGEIHGEGAPDAVQALMAFLGDAVRSAPAKCASSIGCQLRRLIDCELCVGACD